MTTLRAYLRHNQQFLKERDNVTERLSPRQPRTHSNRSALARGPFFPSHPVHALKKLSLPPISELISPSPLFSLQLKRSEALSSYFRGKNQSLVSNRAKTQPKQSTPRSRFSVNLSEWRMRPLDKYFYKMQNIRLAQRLLVVKPSMEMSRQSCKKFYGKQKHYSNQISRNPSSKIQPKQNKKNKFKKAELEQQWAP